MLPLFVSDIGTNSVYRQRVWRAFKPLLVIHFCTMAAVLIAAWGSRSFNVNMSTSCTWVLKCFVSLRLPFFCVSRGDVLRFYPERLEKRGWMADEYFIIPSGAGAGLSASQAESRYANPPRLAVWKRLPTEDFIWRAFRARRTLKNCGTQIKWWRAIRFSIPLTPCLGPPSESWLNVSLRGWDGEERGGDAVCPLCTPPMPRLFLWLPSEKMCRSDVAFREGLGNERGVISRFHTDGILPCLLAFTVHE